MRDETDPWAETLGMAATSVLSTRQSTGSWQGQSLATQPTPPNRPRVNQALATALSELRALFPASQLADTAMEEARLQMLGEALAHGGFNGQEVADAGREHALGPLPASKFFPSPAEIAQYIRASRKANTPEHGSDQHTCMTNLSMIGRTRIARHGAKTEVFEPGSPGEWRGINLETGKPITPWFADGNWRVRRDDARALNDCYKHFDSNYRVYQSGVCYRLEAQ